MSALQEILMRALCGAIITAGAFLCLGLTTLGLGVRYQNFSERETDGTMRQLHIRALDPPIAVGLVVSLGGIIVGLGIAFVGLAYHHERRHRELHRELRELRDQGSAGTRIPV